MRPLRAGIIHLRAAAAQTRWVPFTFRFITRSKLAASYCSAGFRMFMPALFTTIRTGPKASSTASIMACTSASSVMSQRTARYRRPSAAASSARSGALSGWRLQTATSMPFCRNISAMAWPRPLVPPVMSAVRPTGAKGVFMETDMGGSPSSFPKTASPSGEAAVM